MGAWMNLPWALLALCLAPLGLLIPIGAVLFVLKIAAVVQKAAEPHTVDEGGQYGLDQSKDVGQQG